MADGCLSMRFELFIASRYLRAKRRQAVIGVITGISIAGVAAGVASLQQCADAHAEAGQIGAGDRPGDGKDDRRSGRRHQGGDRSGAQKSSLLDR